MATKTKRLTKRELKALARKSSQELTGLARDAERWHDWELAEKHWAEAAILSLREEGLVDDNGLTDAGRKAIGCIPRSTLAYLV